MPDPTDPRLMALQNVQDASRAYGRGRRRGPDANQDPEFRAALEITDPEARRAAMAQYARQRAQALFPQQGGASPSTSGADLVRAAFPQGNAFAGVGTAPPQQADVMAQVAPGPAPDPDGQMYKDLLTFGGPSDLQTWQDAPFAGQYEDSPESVRARTNMGKELLAPRYQERREEAAEAADDRGIEGRDKDDFMGRSTAMPNASNTITARRRLR